MDAWTLVFQWYRRFGTDRILHGTAHDLLMGAPGLGDYFRATGVISPTTEGMSAALGAGHDVVLWPGGEQDEHGSTTRQAAYDLRKLRGKQLVVKPGQARRYHVPPAIAARTIAALLTLREHVIAPILAGVRRPGPGRPPKHLTRIRRDPLRRRRRRGHPHRQRLELRAQRLGLVDQRGARDRHRPPGAHRHDRGQLLRRRPRRAFGGMKDSGIGRELGPEGLNNYLEYKSIFQRRGETLSERSGTTEYDVVVVGAGFAACTCCIGCASRVYRRGSSRPAGMPGKLGSGTGTQERAATWKAWTTSTRAPVEVRSLPMYHCAQLDCFLSTARLSPKGEPARLGLSRMWRAGTLSGHGDLDHSPRGAYRGCPRPLRARPNLTRVGERH